MPSYKSGSRKRGKKNANMSRKSRRRFFQPGSFLSKLFGMEKSKKSRHSRRSKKLMSYNVAEKKGSKKSHRNTGPAKGPYAAFVRANYTLARATVMASGKVAGGLSQATFRELGRMWNAGKGGHAVTSRKSRSYKSKASERYKAHKSKGLVRKSYDTGVGVGRSGVKTSDNILRNLGRYSSKYRATKHRHMKNCPMHKYSKQYGSKKKVGGGVVCVCAVLKKKKKESVSYKSRKSRRSRSGSRKSRRSRSRKSRGGFIRDDKKPSG
jgi:hypothetical protein